MLYADQRDVADAYEGDITQAMSARVSYLLDQVSARLTAAIPALPGWVTGGQVDPALPRGVVVDAVLRLLRNPDGSVTRSQSVDGFSVSTSYSRSQPQSGLFDPSELALLVPPAGRSGPIRMRPWPLMQP